MTRILTSKNLFSVTGSDKIGWSPASIADCQLWWECDFSDKRGRSITPGPPDVYDSIPNLGRFLGTFDAAAAARPTVAYITSNDVIRQVALFDATNDRLQSSLAATNWKNLHSGNFTIFAVYRPTTDSAGYIFATQENNANNTGVAIYFNTEANGGGFTVSNGTGVYVINQSSGVDTVTVGEVCIQEVYVEQGAITEYEIVINGIANVGGPLIGDPSSGDPTNTAAIGAGSNASTDPFGGQIMAIIGYDRSLTDLERAVIRDYLASKYQENGVSVEQNPTFYFDFSTKRSYHIDTGNAQAGEQADILYDLSGNAHQGIQNTNNKQGTMGFDDDNNREVEVDGTADCYALSAAAGWPAGTSHSFWCEYDPDGSTGANQYFVDFATGRLIFAHLGVTGKLGVYDGSWRGLGSAITGEQSVEFHCNDTANTIEAYRTGTLVGQATYGASVAMGGTTALLSHNGQAAGFIDGSIQELWGRDSLMSTTEIFESRAARAAKYPTRWADTLPLVVPVGPEGCWFDTSSADNFVLDGTDIIVAKDCSRQIDDPLVDGDMEAVGTANWASLSGATITKQGGAYQGAQCLRAALAVADTFGAARQVALTVGERYLVEGVAQGDGTNGFPRLYFGGSQNLWNGTTANAWQECVAVETAGFTQLDLGVGGVNGTADYAEWDAVTITPGNHGYQATSANRPTYDVANKCMTFTAANSELLDWVVPNASAGTLLGWVKFGGVQQTLAGSWDTSDYCLLELDGAQKVRAYVGTHVIVSTNTLSTGVWHLLAITWDGSSETLYIDNLPPQSKSDGDSASTRALTVGARDFNGAIDWYLNGSISDVQLRPYAITAAEYAYLYGIGRNP